MFYILDLALYYKKPIYSSSIGIVEEHYRGQNKGKIFDQTQNYLFATVTISVRCEHTRDHRASRYQKMAFPHSKGKLTLLEKTLK